MMERNKFEKLEQIAGRVSELRGVELYDLEVKRAAKGLIVLVFINKPDGVTVDDCQKVSRLISDVLEVEDIIQERYFLEVSSPGLERELKLKKHYEKAVGEMAKITFHNGEKSSTVIGRIMGILPEYVQLEVEGETKQIAFSSIKKAKTHFDFIAK